MIRRLWKEPLEVAKVLRARLHGFHRQFLDSRLPPRSTEPFATHVPALVALGVLIRVRRVLELGCGRYSTPAFLNQSAFPELERLDSYEDDPEWSRQVAETIGSDSRLKLHTLSSSIADAASCMCYDDYDLIFIDNSMLWTQRVATIREVATRCKPYSVIAIHDYEYPPYREAAASLPHRAEFRALNPVTGVLWGVSPLCCDRLRALDQGIARHSSAIGPGDLSRWVEVLRCPRPMWWGTDYRHDTSRGDRIRDDL
jgi:predicted O-methyltransferase YrrM